MMEIIKERKKKGGSRISQLKLNDSSILFKKVLDDSPISIRSQTIVNNEEKEESFVIL